jgi:predicted transcriptional regulator
MEKTVVSTQVDTPVRIRLEQLAAEADRSLSGEIRRAIMEHLRAVDTERGEQ